MPLTTLLPWILAAVVASIAALVTGIRAELPLFAWSASGLFASALVATAVDVNLPWWRRPDAALDPDTPISAAIANGRLLVIAYVWGSLALFAVYRLTALRWQHGLQYGAGMALIAWLTLLYLHFLARPGSRLRNPKALMHVTWLLLAHGGAALVGISFLILSGKIDSIKDDWAANQIFLTGGIAVAALSAAAAFTQFRLARQPAHREVVGS